MRGEPSRWSATGHAVEGAVEAVARRLGVPRQAPGSAAPSTPHGDGRLDGAGSGQVAKAAAGPVDGPVAGQVQVEAPGAVDEASARPWERGVDLVAQVVDYAIIALDPQGTIQTWNAGAERAKGYTADEAVGRHFSMFYTEDDQKDGLPLRLLQEARTTGRVEHRGWRVRKDGTTFWGDVVITAVTDQGGNVTGYVKITRDVTEQHALEESLRESEERFRVLVGQVVDYAIIALDPQGTIRSWNAGAERLKGYTAQEAIGRHFSTFYTAADQRAGLPLQLLVRAQRDGRVEHTGWRVRKDGTQFWADVVITAIRDESGNVTGYAKVTRDLTEQHALEESLRSSEERFRVLVGQVVDYAIIALDPQGTIRSWNTGAERLQGYTANEVIGRHFSMFYPAADQRAGLPLDLLVQARQEGRVEHTGWRVRKDGTQFWGDVVITAIRDESGNVTGYAKVTRDLTDRKRLEEAQDSFYASFEHDFRTPVTAIKGYADLVRDAAPDELPGFVERIEANANRLLIMVEQLVEYARLRAGRTELEIEPVELGALVTETVTSLESILGRDRVVVEDSRVVVHADRAAMQRVVANLVVNAAKYSAADTMVRVRCSEVGGRGRLVVADTGRGIDPDDLSVIFNEFERGRLARPDGGTGLGLSSVKSTVALQGGTVSIDSELGVGTTVTVDLPLA